MTAQLVDWFGWPFLSLHRVLTGICTVANADESILRRIEDIRPDVVVSVGVPRTILPAKFPRLLSASGEFNELTADTLQWCH